MRDLAECQGIILSVRADHARIRKSLLGVLNTFRTIDRRARRVEIAVQMIEPLTSLLAQLRRHFATEEEDGGSREEAVCCCPSLTREARRVDEEHPKRHVPCRHSGGGAAKPKPWCPVQARSCWEESVSQMRTDLSFEPLASCRPSGLKATLQTLLWCPAQAQSSWAEAVSQRQMVPSSWPETSSVPSGLNATALHPDAAERQ